MPDSRAWPEAQGGLQNLAKDPHQGLHTGDLDQGWDITEKVVQSVFSTETQTEGETCLYHGVDAATDVGGNHQTNTSLLGHTNSVEEGRANG